MSALWVVKQEWQSQESTTRDIDQRSHSIDVSVVYHQHQIVNVTKPNVGVAVLRCPTIKPLDEAAIIEAVRYQHG
ncbi:MAG: hypothetical protein WCK93_13115 [Nitrosomonadales bacterium]